MPPEISVGLGLRDGLTPALQRAQQGVERFSSGTQSALGRLNSGFASVRTSFGQFTSVITSFRAGVAGIAGAVGFGLLKNIADLNEQIDDVSATLGVSTEFLSALRFGAKNANVDFQQLEGALSRLLTGFEDLQRDGTGALAKGLQTLGNDFLNAARSASGLEQLLPIIADAFQRTDSAQKAVSASIEIFGRGGQRLIPILRDGSAGLVEIRREADRLGVTLDQNTVRRSKSFTQSVNELSGAFENFRRKVLEPLLPVLTQTLNVLTEILSLGAKAASVLDLSGSPEVLAARERRARIATGDIEGAFARPGESPAERQRRQLREAERPVARRRGLEESIEGARRAREEELREFDERVQRERAEIERQRRLDERESLGDPLFIQRQISRSLAAPLQTEEQARQGRLDLLGEAASQGEDLRNVLESIQDFRLTVDSSDILTAKDDVDRLNEALDQLESPLAGIQAGLDEIAQRGSTFEVFRQSITSLADSLTTNLSNALSQVAEGASSLRGVFKDLARSVLQDIQRIVIRALVLRSVTGLFGLVGGTALPGGLGAIPSFQGGGVGRHGPRGELILAHGDEAHIPLPRGGRVPVDLRGERSEQAVATAARPEVNVTFQVEAIDARSFDDRFFESAARRSRELANVVAAAFSRSPEVREGFR